MKKKNNSEKKNPKTYTFKQLIETTIGACLIIAVLSAGIMYVIKENNLLKDKNIRDILSTYKKVKNNYYENIDDSGLAESAIDSMLSYLDEQYSTYLNKEETDSLNSKLEGEYEGIGIQIVKSGEDVLIVSVFEDSPASKAGLQAGDVIKHVEDLELNSETTIEEVVATIKNKKSVKMNVAREEELKEFEIKVKTLEVPVVTKKTFEAEDKKIGYIYLSSFSSTSYNQVKKAYEELMSEGIDGLIFDVRSNTGGYLSECTKIANLFIKKGKIIYAYEDKDGKKDIVASSNTKFNLPMVVLVDSISASASEILAAALNESYGAILVGYQTYGKGKVQETSNLSNDTMIKYTTAKWYTPSGKNIDGEGLTPGVTVYLSSVYAENPTDENDDQLQTAIKMIINQ